MRITLSAQLVRVVVGLGVLASAVSTQAVGFARNPDAPRADAAEAAAAAVADLEPVLATWPATSLAGQPISTTAPKPADTQVTTTLLRGRAAPGVGGIPSTVLPAYQRAAQTMADRAPGCGLPWWLLAGIGKIESGHASGGRVDATGRTRGEILGPLLDGSLAGTATIRDTDGGRLDGNRSYDRAVGPMQFLPGTWAMYRADGNADGVADPHNVYDAALAAGRYLCAGGGDLRREADLTAAVLRYNNSSDYLAKVVGWGLAYRDGLATIAPLAGRVAGDATTAAKTAAPPVTPAPVPAPTASGPARPGVPATPAPRPSTTPTPRPTSTPSPTTSTPEPTTTPTGTPAPTGTPTPTGTPSTGPSPTPTPTPTSSASGSTGSTDATSSSGVAATGAVTDGAAPAAGDS